MFTLVIEERERILVLTFQERLEDYKLRPWRSRSWRQSWRAPIHDHPQGAKLIPWKPSAKLEFARRSKTSELRILSEPGQDWRLLPIEQRESWRLQMPAAQYVLVCIYKIIIVFCSNNHFVCPCIYLSR